MKMLSDEFLKKKILTRIWDKGRKLEYFLLLSYLEDTDEEIMTELQKYQNEDGGFGHGLEPDIRMPFSSIAATDVAIYALDFVKNHDLKEEMIKKIVTYYENNYDATKKAWNFVTEIVDEFPRAVWWNYENVNSFTYGNPNPELIGFLYQTRRYVTKTDITAQMNRVIDYVNDQFIKEATMHSIQSVLQFYKRMDKDVKNLIKAKLQRTIDVELEKTNGNWDEYSFEPYLVALIDKMLLSNHLDQLDRNFQFNLNKLETGLIEATWQWYQFEDVFEEIKDEWSGLLTLKVVQALRMHNEN
ncbi:MAG: hypothetical protein KJ847_01290 [Firmicutes bacterium]|nr:hypothetical protein [Bacillota bacterium]